MPTADTQEFLKEIDADLASLTRSRTRIKGTPERTILVLQIYDKVDRFLKKQRRIVAEFGQLDG